MFRKTNFTIIVIIIAVFCFYGCGEKADYASIRKIAILEDARTLGGGMLAEYMQSNDPIIRARAAVAAGRIRDKKILPALTTLIEDTDQKTADEAIFALGQIGDPSSFSPLKRSYETAGLEKKLIIIEAMGKLTSDEAAVFLQGLLADLDKNIVAGTIRALAGRKDINSLKLISAKLANPDSTIRTWAYYAAYRMADSSTAQFLLPGLSDSSSLIRKYAAGAIGRTGLREYGRELLPLLKDDDYGVKIQAVRACGKCRVKEAVHELLKMTETKDIHYYREALEALANIGDDNSTRELESLLKGEFGDILKYLIQTISEIEGERFFPFLETYSDYPNPEIRRAVAESLTKMHGYEANKLKLDLIIDVNPGVRCAAFRSLANEKSIRDAIFIEALDDIDWTVRVTAAEILNERNSAAYYDAIFASYKKYSENALPSEMYSIYQILLKIDKEKAIGELRSLGNSKKKAEVETARVLLLEAGCETDAEYVPDFNVYSNEFGLNLGKKAASIMTNKGRFDIELFWEEAPVVCENFVQLANKGFYNKTVFHRVVADFVIQGGEPRGDGWGDPGYTIRDQVNRQNFTAGTVGLPISGYDTGGSQLFVCISDQPHLDGRYTAFGRVVKGMEVLKEISEGDVIEEIIVLEDKSIRFIKL